MFSVNSISTIPPAPVAEKKVISDQMLWLTSLITVNALSYMQDPSIFSSESLLSRVPVVALGAVSGFIVQSRPVESLNSWVNWASTISNFSKAFFDFSPANNDFLNGFALGTNFCHGLNKRQEKAEKEKAEKVQNSQPFLEGTLNQHLLKSLNKSVVGQTRAKKEVAQALALHYQNSPNGSNLRKGNILMMGPSGSGKTLMMESIRECLDVPMVILDASRLTNEGVMGEKLDNAFRQLYSNSNKNLALAEKGIIFLDEIDKIFNEGKTSSNKSIQNQLLTALQGGTFTFKEDDSLTSSSVTINTKNIFFVLAGSFEMLTSPKNKKTQSANSLISVDDLLSFGLKPEFIGRIGHLVQLDPPTSEEFKSILFQEHSNISIRAWEKEFMKYGLRLAIDDELLEDIIAFGLDNGTGVRGLDFYLKQALTPLLMESIDKLFIESMDKFSKGELLLETPLPETTITLSRELWNKTSMVQMRHKNLELPSLRDIKLHLEDKIVGQNIAKNVVAEGVYLHLLRQKKEAQVLHKANILLTGPSGTGKTLIIEEISKKLDIPLATLDASRLTREGIVGSKAEDAILSLLTQTHGNVKKAEKGIIFLDEIDKVFEDSASSAVSIVSGKPIQNQLLRMLQGDSVTVDYGGTKKIVNTQNMLFIMAGAFSNLAKQKNVAVMDEQTLLEGGMMPEFMGRIGYIASTSSLTREELAKTLTSGSDSPLEHWKALFKEQGKILKLSETSQDRIVNSALDKVTGVRGVIKQLHDYLTPRFAEIVQNNEANPQQSREDEEFVV